MVISELPRCGAFAVEVNAVCFRVWAPNNRKVELVLFDGERRRNLSMTAEPGGYFSRLESGIGEGQRYAYRLDNGQERPDPMTLWQPEGIHRPSAVLFPERFLWDERGWQGMRREDLVLYELHVGTFTQEGTFDAVISRLDELRDLGITALELMPVAQFPGGRNWGYDGVHLFAPQNTYGGPHGLQRLVNACHARGLAVFLDVVYNHFGPEGNYHGEFGPYFAHHYRTGWGPAFNYDDAGSDPVRAFVLANVRHWLGAFRLDGLRLDAVHAMFDSSPVPILLEIKETADAAAAQLGRPGHIIAEHIRNDVRILLPPERGGCGVDAEWSDDFHHAVHAYLTGERIGQYMDYGRAQDFPKLLEQTYLFDGCYNQYRGRRFGAPTGGLSGDRFVISIQNHDQTGNRARGDRLATLVSPPKLRLAASLMLLAPHLPMLFMGEEYGETAPFPFFCSFLDRRLVENVRNGRRREYAAFLSGGDIPDLQAEATFAACRLAWSWPEGSARAGLRRLYRDLLRGRREWPALRDFVNRSARLVPDAERAAILQLTRGQGNEALAVHFNLTGEPQTIEVSGAVCRFRSEVCRYGGERPDNDPAEQLLPWECAVFEVKNHA